MVKKIVKSFRQFLVLSLLISLPALSAATDGYGQHKKAQAFIDEMIVEHQFDRNTLEQLFSQAEKKQSIIDAMNRPAEKTKEWFEYRDIFVTSTRSEKGREFWQEHKATLARAEEQYGVPAEIIVAVIGVETRYGHNTGSYRVIDALSTLAFDYPKRETFFRKELKEFLLLAREQDVETDELKGSYAGAMGYGQFMPSSYRMYAVDFDGDDKIDIWNNPVDAIGSVANYFKRHGWENTQPVVTRARVKGDNYQSIVNTSLKPTHTISEMKAFGLVSVDDYAEDTQVMAMRLQGDKGAEFWLGANNFYVITRYNHSKMYAMAVYQLSRDIKK